MTTLFTHPVIPLALAVGLGSKVISPRLLLAGVVVSLLPDMDVVAFRLGIAYGNEFGHRGFSHSLLVAVLVALFGACLCRQLHSTFVRSFLFLLASCVSHSILDSFTNGGLGVALLWPWSETRFFAPVQMIEVSPIRISHFLSARGVTVLKSELLWVWLPFMGTAIVATLFRYGKNRQRTDKTVG
ncbi:MAG: metal-dependent hydrolase [Azovibrio sp.]